MAWVKATATTRSLNDNVGWFTASFLIHSRIHFAPDTHRLNKYYCQLFSEACGLVTAREIKPYHVDRWIDPKVEGRPLGWTSRGFGALEVTAHSDPQDRGTGSIRGR